MGMATLTCWSPSVIDDRVSWLRNDGNGSLEFPTQVLSDSSGTGSVAPADIDGDGDLDLVAGGYFDDEVSWYENTDGKGSFSQQKLISVNAVGLQSVRTGDIDGDGDVDVLSASYIDGKIAWYENLDGAGTFGPERVLRRMAGSIDVHVADLDGDGDLDVLSASARDNTIAWFENTDGSGDFGNVQVLTRRAFGAEWVTTADLDNDGDLDVLGASNGDGRVMWFENQGEGSFGSAQIVVSDGGSNAVEAADIDRDGDLDLVVTQHDLSRIVWLENTGQQQFGDAQVISGGLTRVEALEIADVNGDGTTDIVTASDTTVVWFERVDDQFEIHVVGSGLMRVYEVAAVDIDGDGDLDLISASYLDSKISLYRNQDSSGDLDGDGVVDAADIDLLCQAINGQPPIDEKFDLNADSQVNLDDLDTMIEDIIGTSFGDANLDGTFDSSDLVRIFRAGQYEDDVDNNSGWANGDWNCDGEFDTSDLVVAFSAGGYVRGAQAALPSADVAAAILLSLEENGRPRRLGK